MFGLWIGLWFGVCTVISETLRVRFMDVAIFAGSHDTVPTHFLSPRFDVLYVLSCQLRFWYECDVHVDSVIVFVLVLGSRGVGFSVVVVLAVSVGVVIILARVLCVLHVSSPNMRFCA